MKRCMAIGLLSLAALLGCVSDADNPGSDNPGSNNPGNQVDAFATPDALVATPPNAPGGLTATAVSSSAISLSWTDSSSDETGFKLERSADPGGPFTQIATVAANSTAYADTGLSPSTTYYYRLRATNSAGDSMNSNVASASTQGPALEPPAAPSNLVARNPSTSTVALTWNDNSTNETGFNIERASALAGPFTFVGSTPASSNATSSVTFNNLAAGTWYYRVLATNAAGNSAYSNVASVAVAPPVYALRVQKSGSGAGTITGSGINCGSTCTASYASGSTVALSAAPSSGSIFLSWSGCATASGNTCTITMSQATTVTAVFGVGNPGGSTQIALSLPSTSTTGSYTLGWTCSGICSTSYQVQESPNTAFASVTTYPASNVSPPYSYTFTGKAAGQYCYRVGFGSSNWSAPACITVIPPAQGTLRIVNNTHYDMIDVRLNGVQQAAYPNALLVGRAANFGFTPGTVTYSLGVGFYDSNGNREVWFTLTGSTTIVAGTTSTVSFNNPTIGQLLSLFSGSHTWSGEYWDDNQALHYKSFAFSQSGAWALYDDGNSTGSTGTVSLVAWPDYSSIISFRLCATCQTINIAYPFSSFQYQNGPSSWSIIEYWQ